MTAPATTSGDGVRAGVRASRPYLLPTLALGVSFGILARDAGWGVVAPVVASVLVFSGSAQFALVAVLAAGGGVLAAVGAAALVNARFAPLGLALGPALRGGRVRRALEAQANVDASWVLAHRGDGTFDRGRLFGATLVQAVAWVAGTAVGVAAARLLGDPDRLGLDVVAPAFFLAILAGELGTPERRRVAVLAALVAVALVPVLPAGLPILAAACVALLGLRRA